MMMNTTLNNALFHGDLVKSNRIIYTPSPFAKTNLIHLQETGQLQAQQPHTSKRSHLSSYLFFIVLQGSGTLEYDGVDYLLKPEDCVFIDCRKSYFHRSSGDLWTLKWAHFYGPNLSGIYEKYTERGGRSVFHPQKPEAFRDLLDELYTIAASTDYIRDMRIFEKLTRLLTLIMEESWHPENNARGSTKKQNLQAVKDYLDQHYDEKISLDNLASLFFINKFYLTRIFKEQFGVSVNSYVLQIRVTHAKQMLRFSDMSIEEIGIKCGIEDANYFSRMFKKVEGISPGEYRKMW